MKGYTHAAIGANAIWITILIGHIDTITPLMAGVGAIAGLLPDLDARDSKFHRIFGTYVLARIFPHRTFFHSFLCIFLLFLLCAITLTPLYPPLALVIMVGYMSHPLIDGLTPGGVGYLYPFYSGKEKHHLLPEGYRVSVGGLVDTLLFVAGCGGVVLFFSLFLF